MSLPVSETAEVNIIYFSGRSSFRGTLLPCVVLQLIARFKYGRNFNSYQVLGFFFNVMRGNFHKFSSCVSKWQLIKTQLFTLQKSSAGNQNFTRGLHCHDCDVQKKWLRIKFRDICQQAPHFLFGTKIKTSFQTTNFHQCSFGWADEIFADQDLL